MIPALNGIEDKTPILAGAVDICSCQNFVGLLWFLFCLLRPLVSSLSKSPAGPKNLIQMILFFILLLLLLSEVGALFSDLGHFLSLNWKTILQCQLSQKCFHQIFFSLRWLLFCFLEVQESFPGWTRWTIKKQEGEWMRRAGRFTGLHFLPSTRVRPGNDTRVACSG